MSTGKRSNQVHDIPPKGNEKRTKEKEETLCSICDSTITEGTDDVTGEDAVFCEGDCKSWMHRKCVSMSKIVYDKLSNCEDPYLCPNCIITKQSDEIAELKNLVKNLTSQLTMLKNSSSTNTKISSDSNMESNPPCPASVPSSSEPNKSADHIKSIVSSYLTEEKEKSKR